MLINSLGKLLIYAPTDTASKKRLKYVQKAAEETAKLLKLDLEVVKFRKSLSPIYVYYENGDEEPIPLYCDGGKKSDMEEICATLRKMIFVLSFHPKHSTLQNVRRTITRLS